MVTAPARSLANSADVKPTASTAVRIDWQRPLRFVAPTARRVFGYFISLPDRTLAFLLSLNRPVAILTRAKGPLVVRGDRHSKRNRDHRCAGPTSSPPPRDVRPWHFSLCRFRLEARAAPSSGEGGGRGRKQSGVAAPRAAASSPSSDVERTSEPSAWCTTTRIPLLQPLDGGSRQPRPLRSTNSEGGVR